MSSETKKVAFRSLAGGLIAAHLLLLALHELVGGELQRGSPIGFGPGTPTVIPANASNLVDIAACAQVVIGLRDDGTILAWGGSMWGAADVPKLDRKVIRIAAGYEFGMALTEDGMPHVWGAGGDTRVVVPPPEATNLVDIAGGYMDCFALRADGRVIAWGRDIPFSSKAPESLTNAVMVAGGQGYGVALTATGALVEWGNVGYYGGGTIPREMGVPAALAVNIYGTGLGLSRNGRVYSWGSNVSGQGNVPRTGTFTAIANGLTHAVALDEGGLLRAWGDNSTGATSVPSDFPLVFKIAAGDRQTAALTRAPVVTGISFPPGPIRDGDDIAVQATVLASDDYELRWYRNGVILTTVGNTLQLPLVDVQPPVHGQYMFTASNRFGITRSSQIELWSWPSAPRWISVPSHTTAAPGSVSSLQARAAGTEPLTYQWYHDGVPVPGSTTPTLALAPVTAASDGVYWAVVSNQYATISTEPVYFTSALPALTVQPQDQRARPGWNLKLETAWVSPSSASVQWFHNGKEVPGANEPWLLVTGASASDEGPYNVRVRNASGEVTSRTATVELLPALPDPRPAGIAVLWGSVEHGETEAYKEATDLRMTSVGGSFLAGLHQDGTLEVWGGESLLLPAYPAGGTGLVSIAAGSAQVLGLRADGQALGWGMYVPDHVDGVAQIATAGNGTAFVLTNGLMVTTNFVQPQGLSNIVMASLGAQGLAALADGRVYCWDASGQQQGFPVQHLTNAIAVSAGPWSSAALRRDGTIVMWTPWDMTLKTVPGLSNVVELSPTTVGTARQSSGEIVQYNPDGPAFEGINATSVSGGPGGGSATMTLPYFDAPPRSLRRYAHGTASFQVAVRSASPWVLQWYHDGKPIPGETNTVLALEDLAQHDGGSYFARALNGQGATESSSARLDIDGVPEILSQTESSSVDSGTDLTLTVNAASGSELRYQWFLNALAIANQRTNTLTITDAQPFHSGVYTCRIVNSSGDTWTRDIPVEVRPAPPWFLIQPSAATLSEGETVIFTVAARGLAPIRFQWFHEDQAIAGATNATLEIHHIATKDSGTYHVIASNSAGAKDSDHVLLGTLPAAPVARIIPPFRLVRLGKQLRLDAGVIKGTGFGSMTFQWRHNGEDLPGETNSALVFPYATAETSGSYSVKVRGLLGESESPPSDVRLLPLKVPGLLLTWGSMGITLPNGTLAEEVAGEAYFTAALLPDGTVLAKGSSDVSGLLTACRSLTNIVSIAAAQTSLFALRNDGKVLVCQSSGLSEFSADATNVIALSASPTRAMALRADGSLVGWGFAESETVPLQATNVTAMCVVEQRCVALRADGAVLNWGRVPYPSLLETPNAATNAVAVAASPWQNAALLRDGTVISWGEEGYTDDITNAVQIVSGSSAMLALGSNRQLLYGKTVGIPREDAPSNATNILRLEDGAYSYHAILATPTILTTPSTRTVLSGASLSLRIAAAGAGTLAYQWLHNDQPVPEAVGPELNLVATESAAGAYTVIVSNEYASFRSPTNNFTLIIGIPPRLTVQPSAAVARFGQSVVFQADAAGSTPMGFQWLLDGQPLLGATNKTLTLTNLLSVDRGLWSVRVTNAFGVAESPGVDLVIGAPAKTGAIFNQISMGPNGVELSISEEPDGLYRVQSSTNLLSWRDERVFSVRGGVYRLVDPSMNEPRKFYRVVSP